MIRPLRLCLLFLCLAWHLPSMAQSSKGELKGKLWDAAHKEPLGYATIAVYTAQDTTLVTFRVSDEKGNFKVPNLAFNQPLRLVVTMTGFKVFRKEFTLSATQPELDLGQIDLEQADHLLSEVVITAEAPPIIVRQDTLEFNANSFKTLPTALVEDLLRKLPGVQVDTEGNISVNGRPVQKILVDGKEFFGNDPKVATRNLPADMISKVQVVNDPDALRRDPDMPASEIPQVINLKLKKGIKQGAFGKLYAGKGSEELFEGGGILNIFRDTTQLSVMGYANNLNRPGFGFEDISRIGGFNRSGFNSMMVNSEGGFALNGISFGATGQGIQQSAGAGGNFNTLLKNGMKLNLQYFYGGIDGDLNQVVNSQQFLRDTGQPSDTLNTRRTRDQFSQDRNHRIGGKLEWKLDSLTNLSITPSFTLAESQANQLSLARTTFNFSEPANDSRDTLRRESERKSMSTQVSFERSFKKKGRIFTMFGEYSYSQFEQDQVNRSLNNFYRENPYSLYLDQLRVNDSEGLNTNTNLSYTEPLKKDLSAVVRLSSEYFQDQNDLNTFVYDDERKEYTQLASGLSNRVNRNGWRNYLTTGLRWKIKDVMLQPGVRFTRLDIYNRFQQGVPLNQHFVFVYPSLNINWQQLSFSYNVNVREPNAADLQPVPDNTNLLFVQFGNPELKPSISHSLYLNFRKNDLKRSLNYSTYLSGSITQDAVTRARTINLQDGKQTSTPVNTDGNWQFYSYTTIMKDYKFDGNRQFSIGGGVNLHFNRTLILLDRYRGEALVSMQQGFGRNWNVSPRIEARMNLNDKLEISQRFNLNQQWGRFDNSLANNINITNQTSRSEIIVRLPAKLVWEATLDYWYNSNTAPGLQRSYTRLNAGVTFLFLKNDRAQLKLSVFDALDQNLSAWRSIRENIVEDYQTVVLNRYGLLTFTYNIRNFGGKVGGSNNSFFRF